MSALHRSIVVLLTLLLPAFARTAWAEGQTDVFTLSGLSFRCTGCVERPDGLCEISASGQLRLIACKEMLPELLDRALASAYDSTYPSPEELRSFIISRNETDPDAAKAFTLFVRAQSSDRLLRDNAEFFVREYRKTLTRLILDDRLRHSLLLELWRKYRVVDTTQDYQLIAAIAAAQPQLSLGDLITELDPSNVQGSLIILEEYKRAVSARRPEWVEKIERLKEYLSQCVAPRDLAAACDILRPPSIDPATTSFILDASLQVVLTLLSDPEAKLPQIQKRLERIQPDDFRRIVAQNALVEFLRRVSLEPEANLVREAVASSPLIGTIIQIGKTYPTTSVAIGRFLAQTAFDQASSGTDLERPVKLLEESYRVHPAPISEREAMLKDPKLHLLWRQSAELRVRAPDPMRVVWRVIGALLVAAGVGFLVWNRTRVIPPPPDPEDEATIRELKLLLITFNLGPSASLEQLSKAYKHFAKRMHPDSMGGSTEQFQELQRIYTRARELMELRGERKSA